MGRCGWGGLCFVLCGCVEWVGVLVVCVINIVCCVWCGCVEQAGVLVMCD